MMDETWQCSEGSPADLASPLPCNLEHPVPVTLPNFYFSLPYLVARVVKECLVDICKALYL